MSSSFYSDLDPFDDDQAAHASNQNQGEWSQPTLECSSSMGGHIVNPGLDFLKSIVLEQNHPYWQYDGGWVGLMIVQFRGRETKAVREAPSLLIAFHGQHGFYFQYRERNGGDCFSPYATNNSGQRIAQSIDIDTRQIPLACYVNREIASAIVEEFYVSQQRAAAVNWVNHEQLQIHYGY